MPKLPEQMIKKRPLMRRVFLPLVLAAVFIFPAPATKAGVFNPETFTLGNDMRVVVVQNHRVPVVTHIDRKSVG